MVHAGVYSAVLHYLKAVEALKSDDGTKVIAKMKEMPTDDPLFGKGTIRADGRKIHPAYLVEVKKPAESKGPWDYYKVRATIPADQAFRPLADGELPAGEVSIDRPAPRPRSRRCEAQGRGTGHRCSHGNLRRPDAGAVRPAADRADQRRVLRDAVARARGDLRPAQHHQLHARRAVHDGRVLRVVPAAVRWASATGGRCCSRRSSSARPASSSSARCSSRLYKLDHLYGLLLTFGLALIIQGLFRNEYGSSGLPYRIPEELTGGINLGFMFLPNYRAWVIVASLVVCLATWFVIERTKLGSYLRAATENPRAGAGVRHQRAADDHADLRLRRRRSRRSPA